MKKKILVDENMMRIFSPNWSPVLRRLEELGYIVEKIPSYMCGASDKELVDFVISRGYDGIITEDTDFFETHRSNLLWKLTNSGKVVLTVRRVNPTMSRGEVRVYIYMRDWNGNVKKEELFRLVIDY